MFVNEPPCCTGEVRTTRRGHSCMFQLKEKKKCTLSNPLSLSLPQLTTEYQSLHQGCGQYEALSSSLLRGKKEAENTFLFWKKHSGKTTVSTTLFLCLTPSLVEPCALAKSFLRSERRHPSHLCHCVLFMAFLFKGCRKGMSDIIPLEGTLV